ncbi:TetR/AcrR family transcriptional regulator [Nonomuraea candida]|uniref:TetR/AcrR family transcriptional regulator n=1 Tax=Nonomuraea candida TaxID=359159 RepID=UPI0005BCEF9D|nr:TetR/AcrR family transcriptional regulator [Nonomuraea candida]
MSPDPARRNPHSTAAILRAALELASEGDWSKVSIEGIAARAGVGKRTIYRWWPSKGVIVLDAWVQRLQESLYKRLESADTGDIETDLKQMVRDAYVYTLGDTLQVLAALIGEAQHDPELFKQMWERLLRPTTERVATRIRRAQEQGQLAADIDPYRAIDLIYGQIHHRFLFTPHELDEAFMDDCVDLALRGLRPK